MPRPLGSKNKPKAGLMAMQDFMRDKFMRKSKSMKPDKRQQQRESCIDGVASACDGEVPSTSSTPPSFTATATHCDLFTEDSAHSDADAELTELPFSYTESRPVTPSGDSLVDASIDASTTFEISDDFLCSELFDVGAGVLEQLSHAAIRRMLEAESGGDVVRKALQSMEIVERSNAIRALFAALVEHFQSLTDTRGHASDTVAAFVTQLQPVSLVPPLTDEFLPILAFASGEGINLLRHALGLAHEDESTDDLIDKGISQGMSSQRLRSEDDPVVATFQPLNTSISNPDAPQLPFVRASAYPGGDDTDGSANPVNGLEDAYGVGDGGAEESEESEDEDAPVRNEGRSRQRGKGKGREQGLNTEDAVPRKTSHHSTMPIWLSAHYEEQKKKWNKEIAGDKDRFPLCYRRGDFWDRAPSPWFAMYREIRPNPSVLYRPDIFIWIPDVFFSSTLRCPFCKKGRLNIYETWAPHLRRFVDFGKSCYVAGRRYRCRSCHHSCMSWNPQLLASLPAALSMEFPVHFSHRSGVSRNVMDIMRRCFQLGLGPRPFSNILQVCACLQHDRRHVQYLNMVFQRTNVAPGKFISYLEFDDVNGYAGFIPSPSWLTEMYSRSIEADLIDMVQHTAMLPFQIGAIDHSYKVIQKLMQHLGEKIFGGLFCGNNDYIECRLLDLVASKAQSHLEDALQKLSQSLTLYGHEQPQAIWTDNVRADKPFLEKIFPSLLIDVNAVSEYSELEDLVLPVGWKPIVYNTFDAIDRAMNSLIGELSDAVHDIDGKDGLVVGFDMEWPVDLTTGVYGATCLIQIAYDGVVYLLQVGQLKSKTRLPSGLLGMLRNERITKVGRHIAADLRQLSVDFDLHDIPFKGVAELSKLCKERNVIKDA